jgi:aldehyde:ferredoxin oxidoreductase
MGFMVSPTGADHCVATPDGLLAIEPKFKSFHPLGWITPPDPAEISPRKVAIFKDSQFLNILFDSMVVCHFPGITPEQTGEILKAVTGWDTGLLELMRIAERTVTLMRLFNIREGITGAADRLPDRFFEPTSGGPLSNLKTDRDSYKKALKYYYVLMGWDDSGVPLPEKVQELEID